MVTWGKKVVAVPPGYTIKELLEHQEMKQKEFAIRMDLSEKHISKLINGEVQLTTDVALRLENVLGLSAQFWINLESLYREDLARIEEEKMIDSEIELASKFPYNEMAKNNWVEKASDKNQRVLNLRKFFGVNRLNIAVENSEANVLFRRFGENERSDYALMAWVRKAKIEARDIEASPINISALKKEVATIRKMSTRTPQDFSIELTEKLRECGVVLVLLPHIGGSFLNGATFKDGKKIIIGLTVRGKYADKFWFSLFHEIGHIVLGHLNKEYSDEMENEADIYAMNHLIPMQEYDDFTSLREFTEESVIDFANSIGVDKGIVVGRLQKDNYIKYSDMNTLKTKYELE